MQRRLKTALSALAHYLGAFLLIRYVHRRLFGDGIRILFYHRVEDSSLTPDSLGRTPLTAGEFDRHLRHLKRFWNVLSLQEAVKKLKSGKDIARNSVVVTFDDGYRSNYAVALRLLEKRGLPATFFVVSGAIDGKPLWFDEVDAWFLATTAEKLRLSNINVEFELATTEGRRRAAREVMASLKTLPPDAYRRALSELRDQLVIADPNPQPEQRAILQWEELREMARKNLVTVGAHTVTHPILPLLDSAAERYEIAESCRRLSEELNQPVEYFAYPNGGYDSGTQAVVRDLNLVACATGGNGFNPPGTDLTALNRLGAEGLSRFQFASHLAGWKDIRTEVHRQLQHWLRKSRRGAYLTLELCGFLPLLRFLNRKRLTVLLYHGVTDKPASAHLDNLHVPARQFHRQMAWLRRKYNPVSLEQVVDALHGACELPSRPLLVTFDDAYRNNLDQAWPILRELNIPITLFVPTDFLDNPQSYWAEELEWRIASTTAICVPWLGDVLWLRTPGGRQPVFKRICDDLRDLPPAQRESAWQELRHQLPVDNSKCIQLEARMTWDELCNFSGQTGVAIGSHTISHAILPGLPPDKITFELEQSKRELESKLGRNVVAFAYPSGSWTTQVRELTEKVGYACAFTARPGTNGADVDRFLLNRIGINSTDSFSEFVGAVSGFSRRGFRFPIPKILEIGNYPPPQCGWAMQTKLLTDELRRRGATCAVLNLNESRRLKNREYVDVQSGPDYLLKLMSFALRGYRPHTHVNAESWQGYLLALIANLAARALGKPAVMTFHGGKQQRFFPRPDSYILTIAYRFLFFTAGSITCDSVEIERAIRSQSVTRRPIVSVPCFSRQNLGFHKRILPAKVEAFLKEHNPTFFCFLCFRPEYAIDSLVLAMRQFALHHPGAGFIWLGFPTKEMPAAETYVTAQFGEKPKNLLLLGNLEHDTFMTLLQRCCAYVRTCRDGVSASVLESLSLGVPVIAADNDMRPAGVMTYEWANAEELIQKLAYVCANQQRVKDAIPPPEPDDNIDRIADWLLRDSQLAQAAAGQN